MARSIIKRRDAAGLSQKDLATAAGIRVETLNRLEKGKRSPDLSTLTKIEKALQKAEK